MEPTYSQTPEAQHALALVKNLQRYFVKKLEALSQIFGDNVPFEAVTWLRDEGLHGGGTRYEARDDKLFNRGSVNISQIHYTDLSEKKLDSATAISTIIHPANPHVPSLHMHISWTQYKDGSGYWRIMADLNPAVAYGEDQQRFIDALEFVAPQQFDEGAANGDRYFYIPALQRHRGVAHFYLENYATGDFEEDYAFAKRFGEHVVEAYSSIIADALMRRTEISDDDRAFQLGYHTLYFFQVLTLDRGTTSGLLVHDQNDIGIMGSLPSHVDKTLLQAWIERMTPPQDVLLQSLIDALPEGDVVAIDENTKKRLAEAVRTHYRQYPQALDMQAQSPIVPPTVDNHA